MGKRIIWGQETSDEQVRAWADEAEAGYDVDALQKRWGVLLGLGAQGGAYTVF